MYKHTDNASQDPNNPPLIFPEQNSKSVEVLVGAFFWLPYRNKTVAVSVTISSILFNVWSSHVGIILGYLGSNS